MWDMTEHSVTFARFETITGFPLYLNVETIMGAVRRSDKWEISTSDPKAAYCWDVTLDSGDSFFEEDIEGEEQDSD